MTGDRDDSRPRTPRGSDDDGPPDDSGQPFDETLAFETGEDRSGAAPPSFGRYEVRGLLGRGSFSSVYEGYDTRLRRKVAIKVARLEKERQRDAILQEARRVAALRHPNIVTVHDAGIEGDRFYIVSDLVTGTSLKDWLRRHRPSHAETVTIVAKIADALSVAHAESTIHRDVKPSNVMLTPEREPILLDFGLGLSADEATGLPSGIVGSPVYMSPEQARGHGHRVDGRTDIYSLGVILYEMLTRRLPFRGPSIADTLRRVREDKPQPPRQLDPTIPEELERICLRAMAKRIEQRYTAAGDMASELRQVLPELAEGEEAPARRRAPARAPAPAPRAREAERRQVTVLAGSCRLADPEGRIESLDPELQHELLAAFQELCDAAVNRYGGSILQTVEQGLQVCFGYPLGLEDAAPRAAHAALAIQQRLAQLNTVLEERHGLALAASIAIHSGSAVVGSRGPADGAAGLSVVGEARNVAAGLLPGTESGWVLVTGATAELLGRSFECEPHGSRVPGEAAPAVEVYRVARESGALGSLETGTRAHLVRLIGRAHEVGLLRERWESAAQGIGQVILLTGEAGIGKSRLAAVLRDHAHETAGGEDEPVLEWFCSPYHRNTSLYPATEFFHRMLRLHPEDPPAARLDRLTSHLDRYGMAAPETVALFASLLSLPTSGGLAELGLNPARRRARTLEVLLDWLGAYAERQPVLFIVEDLHWVDATTLELLEQVADQAASSQLLVLLTSRPEFEVPWRSRGHQTQVALSRLTRDELRSMVDEILAPESLPDPLLTQLEERTDGVPLFVEEYARMLDETGAIKGILESARISDSVLPRTIPATLQDLLLARLDRIDSAREVVQLAAALGREFDYELLQAVSPLDEPTLRSELNKLVEAEILFRKGRMPHAHFLFKHQLIRDAAYQTLLRARRRSFHDLIAQALVERFPERAEEVPEILAHHYTEAGELRRGVEQWQRAGLLALERSGTAEAIGHLTRALDLLRDLQESEERDRRELSLQLALGAALMQGRGFGALEVGEAQERARSLCDRLGDRESLFHVLQGTWQWRLVRNEFEPCLELARELLRLAEVQPDPSLRLEAHYPMACALFYTGDFAGARRHFERGFSFFDRDKSQLHSQWVGYNTGVTIQCYGALTLWQLGLPDQALALGDGAVELGRDLDHPYSLAFALYHRGWLQFYCRLGREVTASGEECTRISIEQGYPIGESVGILCEGAGALLEGRLDQAVELLRTGIGRFEYTGASLHISHCRALLAEALWRSSRIDEALSELERARETAARFRELFVEAELLRLRGELLLARGAGDHEEAETSFRGALAVARGQGARSWELRAATSLARHLRDRGRSGEARDILGPVREAFTEGFGTHDLQAASALLAELDGA